MSFTRADGAERLRREYLRQDEGGASAPPRHAARIPKLAERGFTLHAHRLSSLLRGGDDRAAGLTNRKEADAPASSCFKYSAGVRGREAPAAVSQGDEG